MDIVGKNYKNVKRLELRLQERKARLLARSEMEKRRLSHKLSHRAKEHTMVAKSREVRASSQKRMVSGVRKSVHQEVPLQSSVRRKSQAAALRRTPATEMSQETFFDLPQTSVLQGYLGSLRGSVQEHAGSLYKKGLEEHQLDDARGTVVQKVSPVRSAVGAGFLLVLAIGLFIFTSLTTIDIGFWLFFFGLLIWRIDSRLAIGLALACLVAIPLLLVSASMGFDRGEAWAETVAVWAYLFLVIGVVVQIWEYINRK